MPSRVGARSLKSPGWKSAKDVFKTPKSPSPIRRTTRRSSIYQRKPAKSDIIKAKMIVSPPGVKTRARRSSIYQKGGARLLSPGSLPVRTRRTSMYVGAQTNLQSIKEFSKVWATPIKPTKIEQSPKVKDSVVMSDEKKKAATPAKVSATPNTKSIKKSTKKTKITENQPHDIEQRETPIAKNTAPSVKKSAKSNKQRKTAKNNQEVIKISTPIKSFEEMTGKSFYSTPKQAPFTKLEEDLIQFSTGKPKITQRKKRVSMIVTPKSTPKAKGTTSAKKQYRKTPRPTKRPLDDSINTPSLSVKKPRVAATHTLPKSSEEKKMGSSVVRLSPLEMSSVLKSVADAEITRELTPSDQNISIIDDYALGETTPIAIKKGRRLTSKKLTEVVDLNASVEKDANTSAIPYTPNTSVDLNDTIYTDSRSSRCIIL